MDYIISTLNENIEFEERWPYKYELYQVKVRYYICILLAEKMKNISEYSYNKFVLDLKVPVESSLISWLEKVGVDQRITNLLHNYRKIVRNNKAHKFSLSDEVSREYCLEQERILNEIEKLGYPLLKDSYALYYVEKQLDDQTWTGSYRNEQGKMKRLNMPGVYEWKTNHIYLIKQGNTAPSRNSIIDITSFVDTNERVREFYIFLKVEDEYTGSVLFCNIEDSEELTSIKEGFRIKETRSKSMTSAGFIQYNIYNDNYQEFIITDYIQDRINKLESFLRKKEEHLYLLRGNGGVGKTAIVQELLNRQKRKQNKEEKYQDFQYIIFLSAKKYKFQYDRSEVVKIDDCDNSVSNLNDIKNLLIEYFGKTEDEDADINNKKMILVIDDCESFNPNELPKIIEYFRNHLYKLNQKVIFTSRNMVEGVASLYIDNLDQENMLDFIHKAIEDKRYDAETRKLLQDILSVKENVNKIYQITDLGNTLMILYYLESFKYVYANENRVLLELDETEELFDFLHKKIVKWLDLKEVKIVAVLSMLLSNDNLSYNQQKVQYVLCGGRPSREEVWDFNNGIEELRKREVLFVQGDDITLRDRRFISIFRTEFSKLESNDRIMVDTWRARERIIGNRLERLDKCLLDYVINNIEKNRSEDVSIDRLFQLLFEYPNCAISITLEGLRLYSKELDTRGSSVISFINLNKEYFDNISVEEIHSLDYHFFLIERMIKEGYQEEAYELLKKLYEIYKSNIAAEYIEYLKQIVDSLVNRQAAEYNSANLDNEKCQEYAHKIIGEEFKRRKGNIDAIIIYASNENNEVLIGKLVNHLEYIKGLNFGKELEEEYIEFINDAIDDLSS